MSPAKAGLTPKVDDKAARVLSSSSLRKNQMREEKLHITLHPSTENSS
jgi:hypothetical protein